MTSVRCFQYLFMIIIENFVLTMIYGFYFEFGYIHQCTSKSYICYYCYGVIELVMLLIDIVVCETIMLQV